MSVGFGENRHARFDPQSHQTAKNQGGSTTTYTYNSQNELVGLTLPDGSTWTYKYDGLGRRVEKSSGTGAGQTSRQVYDGRNLLAILDSTNSARLVYTNGPGIDEPLSFRVSNTTDYYIHNDALGSVRAHSNVSGNSVEHISYSSFGTPACTDIRTSTPTTANASFTGNTLLFSGKSRDFESGLHNHEARSYDPLLGRFSQEDPAPTSIRMGDNLYIYVRDSPTRFVDPDGRTPVLPLVGIAYSFSIHIHFFLEGQRRYPTHAESKMRHCWASCKITQFHLGLPAAFSSGGWLELVSGDWKGSDSYADDALVDLQANNVGISTGWNYFRTGDSCESGCARFARGIGETACRD